MNITKGPIKTAVRMCLYGVEGIGKSTFASKFPGAVFIDTEGSTKYLDVARFDAPLELNDVIEQIQYVVEHAGDFGTLVIDTGDWLEKLVFQAVCSEKKILNIEDAGYGKGYVYAKQKFQQVLEMLDQVVARGVNVLIVCHSLIRKFELPDAMGSYDRYSLKLNDKNIAPLIKEWVDALLFVNFKTDVITSADGKTKKGTGGQKRVMYANHNACWDAKNRFGLPDEMPFEYEQLAKIIGDTKTKIEVPVKAKTQEQKSAEAIVPPAEVMTEANLPEIPMAPAKGRKKKTEEVVEEIERPDELMSENPEKDASLESLWNKMVASKIFDPMILRSVVSERGYYGIAVPINEYDWDFIRDVLLEAWDQIKGLCITKKNDLPF